MHVDAQIESLLAKYGTSTGEYFAQTPAPQISQLRLPPGTMDAAEFLATLDDMEQQLERARESAMMHAHDLRTGVPQPDLLQQLSREHDEIDALYGDLFRLAHRTRIIDALAFRTQMAELLDIKLHLALTMQRAKAKRICDQRH